jgi:hypothetical protein
MKKLIIFVLFLGLLAAAFLTRPSQADFKQYITDQTTHGENNLLKVSWDQFKADQFVKSCTFNDRLLWVDVQKNGQTLYTGAFGHWFSRAAIADEINNAKHQIDTIKIEKSK